jgi:hypothetical protein
MTTGSTWEEVDAITVTNESGGMQSQLSTDWSYLPWDAAREVVAVIMRNAEEYGGKYPANNWQLISTRDHLNHALHHLISAQQLKNTGASKEDVFVHLTHAACRAMFAVTTHITEV